MQLMRTYQILRENVGWSQISTKPSLHGDFLEESDILGSGSRSARHSCCSRYWLGATDSCFGAKGGSSARDPKHAFSHGAMQSCSMKVALDFSRLKSGHNVVYKARNRAVIFTHPSSVLSLSLPGTPKAHVRWQLGSAPISICHIMESSGLGSQSADAGSQLAVMTEDGSVWLCTAGSLAPQANKKSKTKQSKIEGDVSLDSERKVQSLCEVGKADAHFTTSSGAARILLRDDAGMLVAVEEIPLGGLVISLLEVLSHGIQLVRSWEWSMGYDRCSCISLVTCEQGKSTHFCARTPAA